MADGWNMEAVEAFRKRRNDEGDPLQQLQNEIDGENAPATQPSVSGQDSGSGDPLADLQEQINAGTLQTSTSGVGPYKSNTEYGTAIDPEGEVVRSTIEDETSRYGMGTALLSAARIAVPPSDEIAANLHNYFRPELSSAQWYDVLREKRNKFGEDSPKTKLVTDILGAGAATAGAFGLGALAGVSLPATATAAAAYGVATSPWMPEKRMDEPGYAQEFANDAMTSAIAPYVGPGAAGLIAMPFKILGKVGGKISARVMSIFAKDPEEAAAWLAWSKDSGRYKDIDNPQKAVDDLYKEMNSAVTMIKSSNDQGNIDAKAAKEAYQEVSKAVEKTLDTIQARAKELKEPPSGTAQKIEEQFRNFKKSLVGSGGLYDKAYDAMPSEALWSANPQKFGIPVKQYYDSMMESINKNTSGIVHPEVNNLKAQAKSLFNFHVGSMADDAAKAGVMKPGTVEFFKAHPEVLIDPEAFGKLSTIVNAASGTRGIKVNGNFIPVDDINTSLKFMQNVNPQAMRKYTSTLFKLSDGFASDRDVAGGAQSFLTSESGRKIAGDWRRSFLDALSTKEKFPEFQDFAKLNRQAFDINDTFLKPLENRFTIKTSSREALARTFAGMSGDFEDQMMNSVRAMSRYGNNNDQTLVDLAQKIGNAKRSADNIGSMNMESAIKTMYEMGELQDEATRVLSGLDPIMRNQMSHLETRVLEGADKQAMWNKLAKEAEAFYTKYKPSIYMSPDRMKNSIVQLGGTRVNRVAGSNEQSTAAEGIRNVQMWMNNGDENAANAALNQLQRVREIGLMSKKTVQGSRQTVQAGAVAKLAAFATNRLFGINIDTNAAAAAGIVGNLFADQFTSNKWTKVTPFLIGKMMESKVLDYKATFGRGLLSGQIVRALGDTNYMLNIAPGSNDAMKIIEIIKSENKLTPVEKHKAIKKINEEGIQL